MKGVIKFDPNRVWRTYQGGKMLDQIEGKDPAADSHFPEDWIGSVVRARNPGRNDDDEGLSFITDERLKRIAFQDILKRDTNYYLGTSEGEGSLDTLPLVKYLDSATRLHFQAHPTARFARERLNSNRGKTEAYVILAIREEVENPYIYAGFQRSPSREKLKDWIIAQDIESIEACFTPIPVKAGDVFIIPGGRPHALGEGILMLEIMEASDLAVRFEFERGGYVIPEQSRFLGRDIETALDVFNFEAVDEDSIDETFRCYPKVLESSSDESHLEELIGPDKTSCFSVLRSIVKGTMNKQVKSGFIGVIVDGQGEICIDGDSTRMNCWDRFYCPAGVERLQYGSDQGMTVIECYPGKS